MSTYRVRVQWRTPKEGGRQSEFTGRSYSTVARFAGDPVPWESREAWSVVIDFDESPEGRSPTTGNVRFLSKDAPVEKLKIGETLELYEGSRVTAVGTVTRK